MGVLSLRSWCKRGGGRESERVGEKLGMWGLPSPQSLHFLPLL